MPQLIATKKKSNYSLECNYLKISQPPKGNRHFLHPLKKQHLTMARAGKSIFNSKFQKQESLIYAFSKYYIATFVLKTEMCVQT